jgi:hypothetical protein
MKFLVPALVALMLAAGSASAAVISWGPASLSDDNGGAFIAGHTIVTSGGTFILNLPNYSTSNFDSNISNEVDLGVSVTSNIGIEGIIYTFLGRFSGAAQASYIQTLDANSANGSFSTSPFSGTLASFGSPNSVNLTTQLNLNDNGDSAGISQVRIDVLLPEPATGAMAGMALLALGGLLKFRARG